MKTIAVSGAQGYVGSALVARLLTAGYRVHANVRRGADVPNARTIVGDLCTPGVAARWLEGADAVIHCAAFTGDDDRARAFRDNVQATVAVCNAIPDTARLVFLSSVAVYGKRAHCLTGETQPLDPGSSVYAESKIQAERHVSEASPNAITLRPGLVWGGRGGRLVTGVRDLLARRLLVLPGACLAPMPLTHLDNLLDAIELAVTSDVTGPFNITDGAEVSFAAFCEALAEAHGYPPPHRFVPTRAVTWSVRAMKRLPNPLTRRLRPDVLQLLNTECTFDINRARHHLGYAPTPREHLTPR